MSDETSNGGFENYIHGLHADTPPCNCKIISGEPYSCPQDFVLKINGDGNGTPKSVLFFGCEMSWDEFIEELKRIAMRKKSSGMIRKPPQFVISDEEVKDEV